MNVKERLEARQKIIGRLHAAEDAVHRITGRTDQTPRQIAEAHKDHKDVIAWSVTMKELADFDKQSEDHV